MAKGFLHNKPSTADKSIGLNATASDIASGKTALVNSTIVTGTANTIPNLLGTLTFTGTYNSTTYINTADCTWGCNANGQVVLVFRSGTSNSYENLIFSLASVPSGSGIAIKTGSTAWGASNPTQQYYGCVLTGVTQKINISVNLSAINATYDTVTCSLTITYA